MEFQVLRDTGLSEREAKLYLALLDLGSTTIGPLVDKTDIPSSKIYEVLHRLEEKGLANHIIVKKQKRFQAADPKVILHQLEDRKQAFEQHLKTLQERRKLAKERQTAEFYEGKEAVCSLLRSLVKRAEPGEEYRSFAFDDEHGRKDIASFLSGLAMLRKERKLTTKVIARTKTKTLLEQALTKEAQEAMSIRYTDTDYPEGVIIIGENLILAEWEGTPSAVRIKSRTFTKNYEQFFDELYDKAKH